MFSLPISAGCPLAVPLNKIHRIVSSSSAEKVASRTHLATATALCTRTGIRFRIGRCPGSSAVERQLRTLLVTGSIPARGPHWEMRR